MPKNTQAVEIKKDPAEVVGEKIRGMQAMIDSSPVTNDEECAAVSDKIKSVKTLLAFVKQEMAKLTDPAEAIIKEAKTKYGPFIKECQNAEAVLKGRAQKFLDDKDAAARLEEKRIADRAARGTIKPETAIRKLSEMPEQKATIRTPESGLRRTMKAVPHIVDKSLIPDEFWVIDEVAVRRVALERHKAGAEQIAGVEIKMESQIASV